MSIPQEYSIFKIYTHSYTHSDINRSKTDGGEWKKVVGYSSFVAHTWST